jgi:hypothetical protein
MTALHWAAKRGILKICYYLLKYNSDINAYDIVLNLYFRLEELLCL